MGKKRTCVEFEAGELRKPNALIAHLGGEPLFPLPFDDKCFHDEYEWQEWHLHHCLLCMAAYYQCLICSCFTLEGKHELKADHLPQTFQLILLFESKPFCTDRDHIPLEQINYPKLAFTKKEPCYAYIVYHFLQKRAPESKFPMSNSTYNIRRKQTMWPAQSQELRDASFHQRLPCLESLCNLWHIAPASRCWLVATKKP